MPADEPTSTRGPERASDDGAIRDSFCAHLRSRGYAESTIRQHEQRLIFFIERAARVDRQLTDLGYEELVALLHRLRPPDKQLGRGFIRISAIRPNIRNHLT